MAKFLVTGGAGFIGGNFLHIMVNKYPNDQYVCIDALTYAGNMETLEPIINKPNFKFIHENICNREAVFKLFEEEHFDYVINFAAESHVDRSIENPEIFLKTNILGTQVLMDACRKYGIKRYHKASTDKVYGVLPLDRPDLYFLEKLIPLMIQKALKNEPLPVYGNGSNVRDWLYVGDHCNAIDLIVRNGKDGEVYNIGGHNERSNLEVVKTILKALNKPETLITYVKDRPGHDLRYAMDPTKIETELGWKPEYNFDSGIQETIKWNLNHQDWIDHVESGEYMKWMERYN